MAFGQHQEVAQEPILLGTPANAQEVEDLNHAARAPAAALVDRVHQVRKSRDEAVVADAQQRTARHVTNSGRFDHQHARQAIREPAVPIQHVGGDEAVLGRAPRHHRRHPRTRARREGPDLDGGEQPAGCRRFTAGPGGRGEFGLRLAQAPWTSRMLRIAGGDGARGARQPRDPAENEPSRSPPRSTRLGVVGTHEQSLAMRGTCCLDPRRTRRTVEWLVFGRSSGVAS